MSFMVKNIRKKLGLTQIQLAKYLNTTQGAISHIESGRTELKKSFADELIALASNLGHTVSYDEVFAAYLKESA